MEKRLVPFTVLVGGKEKAVTEDKPANVGTSIKTGKQTRYVDTKETASLVRAKLKKLFPWVKFSVRISRYAGGSSIHVEWTDGPTEKMVQAACEEFRGDYFDGMTDYHGGVVREVNGEQVHYSGSLGYRHNHSKETYLWVVEYIKARYGQEPILKNIDTKYPYFDYVDYRDGVYHWTNSALQNVAVDDKGQRVLVEVKHNDNTPSNILYTY